MVLLAAAVTAVAAEDANYRQGLLWRVESAGAAPSFLYGTLHSADERVLALAPAARLAFDRSGRFALEMVGDETAIRRFRSAMVTPQPGLAATLGAEDFARVGALLAERGVPRRSIGHFKPWAALLVLIQPPEAPGIILDQWLALQATEQGKPVEQIETVDEQIAALDGMAADIQLALLREAAARQDEIALAVRPLVQAYLVGDLAAMWRANLEAMGDAPALAPYNAVFLQRLLFERNERFAERLEPLLRQGGLFAAFGALHLYGERGVPALLVRRGFRVQPVR